MLITRQKNIEPNPLLIEDINNNIRGNIFHVIVLVTYRTFLDKENTTKVIHCADLTNKKPEMTITLLVPTQLFKLHEVKLIANDSVSIRDFEIIPKHKYENGDCEKTICRDDFSIVEYIFHVCTE